MTSAVITGDSTKIVPTMKSYVKKAGKMLELRESLGLEEDVAEREKLEKTLKDIRDTLRGKDIDSKKIRLS